MAKWRAMLKRMQESICETPGQGALAPAQAADLVGLKPCRRIAATHFRGIHPVALSEGLDEAAAAGISGASRDVFDGETARLQLIQCLPQPQLAKDLHRGLSGDG